MELALHVGEWDYSRWQRKFISHFNQPNVRSTIHRIYGEMSEKYVPYESGTLQRAWEANEDYLQWGNGYTPYVHYIYEGIVYRPNFLTKYGWRSPVGKPKYASGVRMKYHTPGTQSHWDRAVFRNDMNRFKWRVTHELKKIAEEEGW